MQWKQFLTPVKRMGAEEAKAYIKTRPEGSFTLLDVRQPGEYENEHLPGAKLIPLPELPSRLGELNPGKPVITYCTVGGRSRAAAQLLAGQGFKQVVNIQGGIKAWNGVKASGPVEMGTVVFRGDETPMAVIPIAYGLEEGLRGFYEVLVERSRDAAISSLFARLAGAEARHKDRLYRLYLLLVPGTGGQKDFEEKVIAGAMEGGLTTAEFMEQNRSALESTTDVLSMAMMIETQALDLYVRVGPKSRHERTKTVLHELAQEEKAHLSTLGRLLETKT
ncbi:MAG: rhodanese-like domain-containing protein [Thermodesulfobacteriota bacterium]